MVDLTIEDQSRLKVIYGSAEGFHAVDLDSAEVYDIYLPKHVSDNTIYILDILNNRFISIQTQGAIIPHCIVALPNSNGMQLLLCYDNEGVYVNTAGRVSKNIVLQASRGSHSLCIFKILNCFVFYFRSGVKCPHRWHT